MRNNICVFCGASEGVNPAYAEQARQLGQLLAAQGRRLIYGGGKKGLMGIVADAVLAAGGEAVGIIPERLVEAETAHRGLTELEVVPDMHTRKARMAALADSFIALPAASARWKSCLKSGPGGKSAITTNRSACSTSTGSTAR